MIESFNIEDNFWVVHPDLKAAGPFKELYTKDKSRNKSVSSKIAWCVKLIWNWKSSFYSLPETGIDNKIELIFGDYYGDSKYYYQNKEKIDKLKDFYLKSTESVARRSLRGIEDKF